MDTGDVRAKFEAFGWDAVEIDGHDMGQIVEALERSRTLDRPAAIVAQTQARGAASPRWRGGSASTASLPAPSRPSEALEELEERARGADEGAPRGRGRGEPD